LPKRTKPEKVPTECPICGEGKVKVFLLLEAYEWDPKRKSFHQLMCIHETSAEEGESVAVCRKNSFGKDTDYYTRAEAAILGCSLTVAGEYAKAKVS
jgi:hypothetical protein